MIDTPFHVRLIICREAAGLTQQQVADLAGVSARFMRSFEAGDREPNVATLRRLCAAVGVSASVLVDPAPQGGAWRHP